MVDTTRPAPADVFVIFGITGDLAKVMTFHSLYRLEKRGLLDCPIVGVAADDWTVMQLRDHARESIVATGEKIDDDVFARFADRMSYVSGDFTDAGTCHDVANKMRGATMPMFYLEIPPFLFGKVIGNLTEAGLTKSGRVVVEKPSVTTWPPPARSPTRFINTSMNRSFTESTISSARWAPKNCSISGSRTR
jgi:glucose-6-phosphate 1-dehydrogenase